MTSRRARIEQDVERLRAQPADAPPPLERIVAMSSDDYEDPQADLDLVSLVVEQNFPGVTTQREGQYPRYQVFARIPAGTSVNDVRRLAEGWVLAHGRRKAGAAPYRPAYGHGPEEYQSGYRYAQEAARHEQRVDARATLEQLQAGSKTDFIRGQIAAYQERLGDLPSPPPPVARGTTRRAVEVDTSVYRRLHGAEPRGRGDWTFVIGKRSYETSGDPALYRPAQTHGTRRGGIASLPYGRAREYAVAEARRRGATVVGVAP